MKSPSLCFLLCALGFSPLSVTAETLLFESDEVMEISIPVDFKSLCRPHEDSDCEFIPTVLNYDEPGGEPRSIPIEIKVRGGWRSLTRNCSIPLLWVRFDQRQTANSPFEGQRLLPLTTHCGRGLSLESTQSGAGRSDWEQYLLREYLGHRLYNLLTEVSIRARLVKIEYPNPDHPGRTVRNYAFFTEHFDSVAERNDVDVLSRPGFDYEKLDTHSADVLALFQFMIGNTDWSIVRERNTVLMQTNSGKQVPVPYDLDMSGLVDAHYAGPAPGLPIDTVLERYYLGFCHPDIDWIELFQYFRSQRYEVLAMVDGIPGLDRKNTRQVKRFLEQFFKILDSQSEYEKYIVEGCQPWPPSPIDHTTPAEKR
jgi:hypothetical protein